MSRGVMYCRISDGRASSPSAPEQSVVPSGAEECDQNNVLAPPVCACVGAADRPGRLGGGVARHSTDRHSSAATAAAQAVAALPALRRAQLSVTGNGTTYTGSATLHPAHSRGTREDEAALTDDVVFSLLLLTTPRARSEKTGPCNKQQKRLPGLLSVNSSDATSLRSGNRLPRRSAFSRGYPRADPATVTPWKRRITSSA